MSAQLKPVELAIVAPTYNNANLSMRDWWVTDNAAALVDYWQACGGTDPDADFESFCWVQWDRQTAIKHERCNTLRFA
jgi:hypothetical protein